MDHHPPPFVNPVQPQAIEPNLTLNSSPQSGPNAGESLPEGPGTSTTTCPKCGNNFSQEQTRKRHQEEVHGPSLLCSENNPKGGGPCNFKRCRRYAYRKHLRNVHGMKDGQINKILGRPRSHVRKNDSSPPTGIKRRTCRRVSAAPTKDTPSAVGTDASYAPASVVPPPADNGHLASQPNEYTEPHYSPSPDMGGSIPPNVEIPGFHTFAPSSSAAESPPLSNCDLWMDVDPVVIPMWLW